MFRWLRSWVNISYERDQVTIADLSSRIQTLDAERRTMQEMLEGERSAHIQALKQVTNWLALQSTGVSAPFHDVPQGEFVSRGTDPEPSAPPVMTAAQRARAGRDEFFEKMKGKVVTPAANWAATTGQIVRDEDEPKDEEVKPNGSAPREPSDG